MSVPPFPRRGKFETDQDYKNRVAQFLDDLDDNLTVASAFEDVLIQELVEGFDDDIDIPKSLTENIDALFEKAQKRANKYSKMRQEQKRDRQHEPKIDPPQNPTFGSMDM